jgi:hypothetical protein
MIPIESFKNYHRSYGRNLSLNLVNSNIINQQSLIQGKYYGLSGEGIINRLSTQWTTFHIIRYDGGMERGFLNIHCLFSLYFNIDISGRRTVFWTKGIDNNTIRVLNNIIFYQLPKDNIRDMIMEDETFDDDKKKVMLEELDEERSISSSESSILTCTICMTNPLNRVLSCGHTLCSTCVENSGYHNCHMCRRTINRQIDVRPLYFG